MASLAQVAVDAAAVPFEGVEPEALLASVRVMLARQLLDDLSFLGTAPATSALYALAIALPAHGLERRELGRRVLSQLHQGDAVSFVALATGLALGSTRAFDGPQMRARINLMLCVPASGAAYVDPLAFALLSRRELCNRFLIEPATQDLPARRMAARLLESAARHAAFRAQQGDDGELAVFDAPHVHKLFAQLLLDREPAVFRHAASARGMLSANVPRYAEELEQDLTARDKPSRMRRGAISLAARLAVSPEDALPRALELLRGPAMLRDPGLAAALIQGLLRVVELEPELAEQLLLEALARGGALAVEALLDLRRELYGSHYCERATKVALQQLQQIGDSGAADADQLEHLAMLREALEPELPTRGPRLTDQLAEALLVYARSGPLAALEAAQAALATATRHVEHLALLDPSQGRRARRELFRLQYELDLGLLESSALFDLLAAGATTADGSRATSQLTTLLMRLLGALMVHEELPHEGDGSVPHLALRMRRLRLLMHLLDTDYKPAEEQVLSLRAQQLAAVQRLASRIALDAPSALDRVVHAALARGVESLMRSETFELADAVLCLAHAVPRSEGMLAVAEGCLLPDLKYALRASFTLLQALENPATPPPSVVIALANVAHALPSDDSPRTEALRRALLALERALESLLAAHSIRELVRSRRALTLFEGSLIELAYLDRGAQRRLGERPGGVVIDESPVASIARALESAAAQGERSDLGPTLEWLDRELARTLPLPFAQAISRVLGTLRDWPLEGPETSSCAPLLMASAEAFPLPGWLPPSRRLGNFSVIRPLGAGLGSSVFLVKRTEERGDPKTTGLALKVPRYDARVARALSALQFEEAFARELPALLSVPPNEHLASFVSIEPTSRPKPFLVMEWIEGPTLARVRKRQLDPVHLLDGVLAGLEQLHALGIGHLDVSPSRIVLRKRGAGLVPVLVDFGLAGRQVRAGTGDASYRAPELWQSERALSIAPAPVDVYAVGCLAYELVTGRPLFHGASESQIAAQHREHDGTPSGIAELAKEAKHARLADWIVLALRSDPAQRPAASELRKTLRSI
ncbi:MAG: serine/threonine protein kinase [Myxococcaceae bacterium]|nr:serine/threonine protein kinase [Myxococcaceae bacterium]